tara:strand:+ start:4096 stop:4578 length:483 start_codon:yes stop_codon:yes gene_type:complete
MSKDLKCILITNLCTKCRIRTADEHIIQCFSGFYKHPALINEDAWHLVKSGNVKLMVDSDTMHLMEGMVCDWGFDSKSDTVITMKLTSTIKDKDERIAKWNALYEYSMNLRSAMDSHYDSDKIDQVTDLLKKTTISDASQEDSDSVDGDHTPGKTPVEKA